LNTLVLVLAGMAAILLQATLLQHLLPACLIPDSTLLLVLFASVAFPFSRGLVASVLLGLLADLSSGAPEGWNTLLAICVFLLNRSILARIYVKPSRAALGLFLLDFALKLPYLFLLSTLFGFPHLSLHGVLYIWAGEWLASLLLMPLLFRRLTEILGIEKIQWLTARNIGLR
jgi:rod shape-determining protein MreD